MNMKTRALWIGGLLWSLALLPLPQTAQAEWSAQEIIGLAQRQLAVPAEFVLGDMKVFHGTKLTRSYSFVMGRLWEADTRTELVRIDFKTALNTSLHTDHRYLLKRAAQAPASQWLYLPALRRVRIVPYQPDDPLLQSHYLFYDLTPLRNFGDYHYRFLDPNPQAPVIEGRPHETALSVPYDAVVLHLERRGETYLLTAIHGTVRGKPKHARFSAFTEIAPGRYRPRQLSVEEEGGRTELFFSQWTITAPKPHLLTPTHLETQTLVLPTTPP